MIDNVINISMYAYDLHKTGGISPTYNSNIVHPQIGTKHQRILTGRRFYNSPWSIPNAPKSGFSIKMWYVIL